jgi:hypothetical protein
VALSARRSPKGCRTLATDEFDEFEETGMGPETMQRNVRRQGGESQTTDEPEQGVSFDSTLGSARRATGLHEPLLPQHRPG